MTAHQRIVIATFSLASNMFRRVLREFKVAARAELREMVVGDEMRARVDVILGRLSNPLAQSEIAHLCEVTDRTVKRWAKVDPLDAPFDAFEVAGGRGRKRKMTDDDLKVIDDSVRKKNRSTRTMARSTPVSHMTIWRELKRRSFHAYKLFRVPFLTEMNIGHRLLLSEWVLRTWDREDCLRLRPSDEFFLWSIRRPNNQNDRIWARTREEIVDLLATPQLAHPACIGVFLMFSANGLIFDVKSYGQSWDGHYFREIIVKRKVLPFLLDEGDVLSTPVMLHDMAGCFRAKATHALLDSYGVDFFRSSASEGYPRWPGHSPDLNPAENIGSILMSTFEEMLSYEEHPGEVETMKEVLVAVCENLSGRTDLFRSLLLSFYDRMLLVRDNDGKQIKKY